VAMAKSDGKRRSRISVPKLEDATLAGTKHSKSCTLVLTEGDSAAASAVAAVAAVGRKTYGVFPLRGKVMNARSESLDKVAKNVEISNIKKILGLESGKRYGESLEGLRYGSVVVLTDADKDGSHIKGLVQNLFHVFWPELLEMGFVRTVLTPIVKATRNQKASGGAPGGAKKKAAGAGPTPANVCKFYSEADAEDFIRGLSAAERARWSFKYYKGLGTSSNAEAREFFKDNRVQTYTMTPESGEAMSLAFDSARADDRKDWIRRSVAARGVPSELKEVPLELFVNEDLVGYSRESVVRSIPSAMDGLKPSQRKILFAAMKRAVKETKLVQLAGFVSERAAYHHGEASLNQAIVGMAQNYPGSSNNANLLEPIGQFGTRRLGGSDSAQPRYVSTRLAAVARLAFPAEDDELLRYMQDDGQSIEPEYYVPVIPWALCNALHGIGTGFACTSPPFNPLHVLRAVRARLEGGRAPRLQPWYRGMRSEIRPDGKGGHEAVAKYSVRGSVLHVEDLPAGVSNEKYVAALEKLVEARVVKDFCNTSESERDASFEVTLENGGPEVAGDARAFEKKLQLVRSLKFNMTLWGADGVKAYASAEELIDDFMPVRLELYRRRRSMLIERAKAEAADAEVRARFIEAVVSGALDLRGPWREVTEQVRAQGFDPALLEMPMSRMTEEKARELREKAEGAAVRVRRAEESTAETLWAADLAALETQLQIDEEAYDP